MGGGVSGKMEKMALCISIENWYSTGVTGFRPYSKTDMELTNIRELRLSSEDP